MIQNTIARISHAKKNTSKSDMVRHEMESEIPLYCFGFCHSNRR